jgi:hypothetical protein
MRVRLAVDPSISDALEFWLHSQGHTSLVDSDQELQHTTKLALDYAHIKPYLWGQTPMPDHWPKVDDWLLIDAYLDHCQLICVMQLGCRHISIAPLHENILTAWLNGVAQVPQLACDGLQSLHFESNVEPATEPMLAAFVNLMMADHWSQEAQVSQVGIIAWRNVALRAPVFSKLKQQFRLGPVGFAQLACHTLAGGQWLLQQGLNQAATVANQHHEHWDGSGYPMGIKAEAICLAARLAKLYDSYLGLRKNKRYAKACDHATSINKLRHGDGYLSPSQFDPQLLTRFLAAQQAVEDLYNLYHTSDD